jgi:broad specificity phosphatase PhoE
VPRLYLVRHGRPAGTFTDASDAGLDSAGVAQAEAMAGRLGPLGPLSIVVSPLRRTRETAAPLERRWGAGRVEPAVGEIPTPAHVALTSRGAWLRSVMTGTWRDVDPGLRDWRDRVLGALVTLPQSAVVVTHFVAINAAVGAATADDRVMSFSPDHCSVTVLEVDGGRLRLVERGADGAAARPM